MGYFPYASMQQNLASYIKQGQNLLVKQSERINCLHLAVRFEARLCLMTKMTISTAHQLVRLSVKKDQPVIWILVRLDFV